MRMDVLGLIEGMGKVMVGRCMFMYVWMMIENNCIYGFGNMLLLFLRWLNWVLVYCMLEELLLDKLKEWRCLEVIGNGFI